MSLGYDLAQALPMLRAEAESRMTETFTIGKLQRVRQPGSLEGTIELVEIYYSGIGRLKYPYATVLAKAPAGQQLVEMSIIASIPSSSPPMPTGAVIRVDASSSDPSLVGLLVRIDGPAQAGQTTAHRYPVVEES